MTSEIEFEWRGEISDSELVALTESHGGRSEAGWWDRIRPYSLGWVTARDSAGDVAGFVNVAWDGSSHAFLLDTKVRSDLRSFYFDACGFTTTNAGLIALRF